MGTTMWATLVPVLIGGLLTLAGGFIGPFFLQRQKDTAEHKKRRADKFEELVASVYEFDHWVDMYRRRVAFGEDIPHAVSPFAKVQSISSVYFPQFDDAVKELSVAASGYQVWLTGAGKKRLAGDVQHMNDGFNEAYKPFLGKRDGLINALKKFAQGDFQ